MKNSLKKSFFVIAVVLFITLTGSLVILNLCQFFGRTAAMAESGAEADEPETKPAREPLATRSYLLEDNGGYNIGGKTPTDDHPLGGNYADVLLQVKGGKVLNPNTSVNGVPSYAYSLDEEVKDDDIAGVSLLLKYNYPKPEKINGTGWSISNDTHKSAINGIIGAGEVKSGALLIQKSKTGNANDWTWQNPMSGMKTEGFHSTDFVNNYKPSEYDGKEHENVERSRKKLDENGEPVKNDDGTYQYENYYTDTDGYLPIYTPLGGDLKQGYF